MKEHPIATGTIGADGPAARPVTEAGRTREEQALVELGHTTFSRGVAWALTAAFLATIALVPVIQGWSALRERRARPAAAGVRAGLVHAGVPDAFAVTARIRQLVARVPTEHQLRRVETLMEQQSVVGAFVRSRVQGLLTRWFGVGNDNVYIGADRWLFYRAGVEYVVGPGFLSPSFLARRRASTEELEPDPRPAIVRFHDQLAQRGIALVVMPTPDKIMIHPDRFYADGLARPSMPQNASYPEFRSELEQKGIQFVDPAPALYALRTEQQLFLPADTHWTPSTGVTVAQALATAIRGLPHWRAAPSNFQARDVDVVLPQFDMVNLLQLPAGLEFVAPVQVRARQVLSATGELWAPVPSAGVLMLGDSFCMVYENDQAGRPLAAGLPQQLSYELGQPVDRICAAGGGSYFARLMLVSQLIAGARTLEHLRVVVWQFTIRELVAGDWRVIDLP